MKIEYNTKEELTTEYEKAMKKFEKPVWTIEKTIVGDISIYKNGNYKATLLFNGFEGNEYNLNNLAWNMARAMGDLMSTKDRLNPKKMGFSFHLKNNDNEFLGVFSYDDIIFKNFKTQKIMEEAVELVENSQVIKDYIDEMREGK